MNYITSDRFRDICDNYDIIYSHNNKNSILKSFEKIRTNNSKKILITTNGDNTIDHSYINMLPDNLYKWFSTNVIIEHDKIECIPYGLQPEETTELGQNGVRVSRLKKTLLTQKKNIDAEYKIYANFAVGTNSNVRNVIKQKCIDTNFITSDFDMDFSNYMTYNNQSSLDHFYTNISLHEATICPIGNGIDTHRLYEVLYLDRIPIVFNENLFRYLYKDHFKVIYVDDLSKISDENFMDREINRVKLSKITHEPLDFSFWEKKIKNTLNLLKNDKQNNFIQ